MELKSLIKSGVKVNKERKQAFARLKRISNDKIDMNQIESKLDNFISKSVEPGATVNDHAKALDNSLNTILKPKQ